MRTSRFVQKFAASCKNINKYPILALEFKISCGTVSLPIPLILYKLLYREVNLICNAPFAHFWSGVLHFRFGELFTLNLALVFSFKVFLQSVSTYCFGGDKRIDKRTNHEYENRL